MSRYFFLVGILLLLNNSFGQQLDPTIEITLNPETSSISDTDRAKIPFDEKFFIKGTLQEREADLLKVKIKIANHCLNIGEEGCYEKYKSNDYYFYNKVDESGYKNLNTLKLNNKSFRVLIPPLHPNEQYEFQFIFYENLGDNKQISDEAINVITNYINEIVSFDSPILFNDIKQINSELKDRLYPITGVNNYFTKDGVEANLEQLLTESQIEEFEEFILLNNDIYKKYEDLNYYIRGNKPPINKRIYEIIGDSTFVSDLEKIRSDDEIWKKLEKSSPSNFTLSMADILDILILDTKSNPYIDKDFEGDTYYEIPFIKANQNRVFEILAGEKKLDGKNIVDNDSIISLTSGMAIFETFRKTIDLGSKKGYFKDIDTDVFREWTKTVNHIQGSIEETRDLAENYPNLLSGLYSSFYVPLDLSTKVNISTSESPYLGVDFGVFIAPEINSTFILDGINFHLKPVNRSAKYSDLKKFDEFLKRTSIQIGLVQRIGSYEDRFEKYFDLGSPYFGIGFRVIPILRMNLGGIFYKEKNVNPIITDLNTEFTWGISASLDVELKDALSIFGKLIKP
ncbi:hypothetical protein [Salegentibacter sp. T436]|uniref:hypothetical protein n=1 Tax=Salegentibacter sp. T436 TaxID=1729720 RepID=UPI00094A5318|nr:hypothetical protein [Salegentibacter sp. T436]APS40604.1 hypothetical protein AO058_17740 [Salegentibacter sp. T436]